MPADRAISIDASPQVVYAWLCQLRVAPYSYDLLDRFGRRSPRRRDPDLAELEVGQRFMSQFDLVSFVPDRHITLVTGKICVTYAVRPREAEPASWSGCTAVHRQVVARVRPSAA